MSFSIVGTPATLGETTEYATRNMAVPAGVNAGDAIFLLTTAYVTSAGTVVSLSTTVGFTQVGSTLLPGGSSNHPAQLFACPNALGNESGATVTINTPGDGAVAALMFVVRGAAAAAIDQYATGISGHSTSHPAPTTAATVTAGDGILVFTADTGSSSTTFTPTTGQTVIGTANETYAHTYAVAGYDFTTLPPAGTTVNGGTWTTSDVTYTGMWTVALSPNIVVAYTGGVTAETVTVTPTASGTLAWTGGGTRATTVGLTAAGFPSIGGASTLAVTTAGTATGVVINTVGGNITVTVGLTASATGTRSSLAVLPLVAGLVASGVRRRDITLVGSMESDRFTGLVLPDNYPVAL